ncbi:hypothetical protein ACS0TY_003855 [Phlomoides rotata]
MVGLKAAVQRWDESEVVTSLQSIVSGAEDGDVVGGESEVGIMVILIMAGAEGSDAVGYKSEFEFNFQSFPTLTTLGSGFISAKEFCEGTYFQVVVVAAKCDGGMDDNSSFTENGATMISEEAMLNCQENYHFLWDVPLTGNIRVFCRCRPLSKSEVVSHCASVVDFDAAKDG